MEEPNFRELSVLLVDDSHAMRILIRTLLRSFGIIDVVEANDGARALELLQSQPRDLVITDLSMRPMNGLEFARHLRRPGKGGNPLVPILMISSHGEIENVREAINVGVTEYMVKPFTSAGLRVRIKEIVERPKPIITAATYSGPDRRRSLIGSNRKRRRTDLATEPTVLL